MSATDWHDVETPGGPEGIADLADDSAPTRVDEETGDTPGSVASQEYVDSPIPFNADDPIAVAIVKEVEPPHIKLACGQYRIPENGIVQIAGHSLKRRSINIKVKMESPANDYVLISPNREDVDVGYRLDDGEKEEIDTIDPIYAKAIGGFADIYFYTEDF